MFEYDDLGLYAGDDVYITDKIIVTQPTLQQIRKFGEKLYFGSVSALTSVGADMKWQLWENGVDYTKIDDYDFFIKYILHIISSKKRLYCKIMDNKNEYSNILNNMSRSDLNGMLKNPMELVFKDLDFSDFIPVKNKREDNSEEIVLYNAEKDIVINRIVYRQIVDVVRKIHGFKRNNETPANEQTKMDLIEDARDEFEMASNKPFKSVIRPLLSTLKIATGQCGGDTIWNMKINEFFYDIRRLGKVKEAERLLQGACSGFASLKGVDKDRLDMFAEINSAF